MKTHPLLKATWISILIVEMTIAVFSQTSLNTPTPSPTPTPPTRILYTGKLLGYFRVPSLQDFNARAGCPAKSELDSDAAIKFLAKRDHYRDAVLLGAGDNFSPQLEARVFSDSLSSYQSAQKYRPRNKELFVSDGLKWIHYESVPGPLNNTIKAGLGTIHTDNVACFLRAAEYDAIVPGKHDFYFGPERVRQLARFLASDDKQTNLPSVQMLGANLIMKTVAIEDAAPSPKVVGDHWFKDWPEPYAPINLKDGSAVYPWFSYVKFKLIELNLNERSTKKLKEGFSADGVMKRGIDFPSLVNSARTALNPPSLTPKQRQDEEGQVRRDSSALEKASKAYEELQKLRVLVCASLGDPNQIPENLSTCRPLIDRQVRLAGNTILYYLAIPVKDAGKNNHFSTLSRATNYALCTDVKTTQGCLRFSVHNPFFYFPNEIPKTNPTYTDPDPFVIKNDSVAIFGVVDPDLGQHVGTLNFGWRNTEGLTTKLVVGDPADALSQQLDYFDYFLWLQRKSFTGTKILLAQMSPQRARALAGKFPEFQVVVSAADQEQATTGVSSTTNSLADAPVGPFLAVPSPYYDSASRKGFVQLGQIDITRNGNDWAFLTTPIEKAEVSEPEDPADNFWRRIKMLPGCVPSSFDTGDEDKQMYLKWLVLCAMRDATQADVALIQSRDLYDKLPILPAATEIYKRLLNRSGIGRKTDKDPESGAESDENVQQMLDRLIWKGDFLTLLYVPGSALKKALEQSAQFTAEDTATLSLGAERGRKLETLGVAEVDDEYIVNEMPLDEDKIYAVATTDYIGAGDTGYPDLVKAALNPRTHPAAFDRPLVSVSSLVCRKLFNGAAADKYCLGPVIPNDYLDTTSAERAQPYQRLNIAQRFWAASPFKWPGKSQLPDTIADAIEQQVQRRPIWTLSLRKLSFTISDLNNNLTKDEIKKAFAGVSETSSVTDEESRSYNIEVGTRLSRSSHERELFFDWGFEYKRVATGDKPSLFTVSQPANRMFSDIGFVWWRKPGRAAVNVGTSISLHAETPLVHPFTTFTLTTDDKLRIDYSRSLTLLPRLGLRWQNRKNSFEFGFQAGREINALRGFSFTTTGEPVNCEASSDKTISTCIEENSDPKTGGLITSLSIGTALYGDRPRAGAYWKANLSVPIPLPWFSDLKYEFEDEADFFFVNFHKDTSIDTRFRDISKHKISFSPFPSVSIGPSLQLLMFQNKRNRDFLFQRQLGIETTISFDIFNRREKGVQVKHKP